MLQRIPANINVNKPQLYWFLFIHIVLLASCGGGESNQSSTQQLTGPSATIEPQFLVAKTVLSQQAANASGQFIQPANSEVFTGNILASITASDPDGLARVALSFNQSEQLKYLCEPGDNCPQGSFNKTETSINPADYGVFIGPLTMGLWTLDKLGNQMLVDSVTLDWQLRRILGASVSRSADGTSLDINWQNDNDLLRYNVLVAADPGINLQNYATLIEGQALLSVQSGPQTISGLTANQVYYVLITGVDGSGESSFSSEFRLAPPSGFDNTPPVVSIETLNSLEEQSVNGNVLRNDNDPESDPLSLSPLPIKFPLNGDVTLSRDGSFVYQPKTDFNGSDNFTYEVQDGQGGISQGSVTITIANVNDAPAAAPDSFTAEENQVLTVAAPGLLGNDSDIDGDNLLLTTTPITAPNHGTLSLLANGSFSYTPNQDYTGTDFFVYQITDSQGLTSTSQVNLAIGQNNINTAPLAVNDSYRVDEDQTLSIRSSAINAILANDSDPENDPLQLSANLITTVNNGVLTIDTSGGFTYIPNGNFFGSDSFTYQISDGQGNSAQATATILIDPINDAPNALDDIYTIEMNTTLSTNAPGLLVNDTDLDQDGLAVIITPITPPQNGVLNLLPDGSFVYSPNNNFTGQDSFTYQITDGRNGTANAQAFINVNNQQVLLNGFSLTTSGMLTLQGVGETAVGSGVGQVRYILGDCIQTTLTECTLTGTYQEESDSQYDPNAIGTFTMVLTYSGIGASPLIAQSSQAGGDNLFFNDLADASFKLTLMPSTGGKIIGYFPALPPADNINFSAFLDSSATCIGLAIGQECTVGQVGLVPDASITGPVSSFTFSVIDPVLTINVAPIANNDTAAIAEDNIASINVLANDTDADGDTLEVTNASVDTGIVTIESNNQLTYTPNANFFGDATISYTIDDNNGNTADGSVAITVNSVNDQPIVVSESGLTTNSFQTMIIDALANDSDLDQDSLTLVDASTNFGSVDIINNQLYFSAAGLAENTAVQITYQVSDGSVGTVGGLANVIVGNRNPKVNPDSFSALPNTTIVIDNSIVSPAPILIENDSDLDATDTISYLQQSFAVQNGSYNENFTVPSGFDYTPDDFIGIDGGFYQITDDSGNNGEGLFTIQVSDISWYPKTSAPNVPVIDFLDLSFDGFNYSWFNNDGIVRAPSVGSGRYYAVSGRMVISSNNKNDWQVEYASNSGNLKAIASGYSQTNPLINTHIVVGNAGTVLINQTSSSSASHWLEVPTGLTIPFNNIYFDGKQFIAVGLQTVAFSTNGYSWTTATTMNSREYRDVIVAGGQYVIVGDDGSIETSSDGNTWQAQVSGINAQLNAISYSNGMYIVVGTGGTILSSNNGTSWQAVNSGINVTLNKVVSRDSIFIAVGDNNTVLTSDDGINWTLQGGIDTSNVRSILSDGSILMLGSDNGDLFTTNNAVDFIPLSSQANDMYAIAFDGVNTLVRAGQSYINLSTDGGQTWTLLVGLGIVNLNEINYFNGQFIAVGDNGLLMTSSDGSNWNTINTGTVENLNDIFWFSGLDDQAAPFSLYVTVGNNGTILTSTTGTVWTTEVIAPLNIRRLICHQP